MEEIEAENCPRGISEEKLDLFIAVDKLSEIEKTIVILKYFQDLKIKEISEIMVLVF